MEGKKTLPRPNFGDEIILIQNDYLEIIIFIILNASLVYELDNNHHQAAKY